MVIACIGIEQAFVHVDVDNLRAVFDLLARDLDRGFIIAGQDQLLELGAAGDVGAFADVDERGTVGRVVLGCWSFSLYHCHSREGGIMA